MLPLGTTVQLNAVYVPVIVFSVGLIRFRGRFPKGGYDVPDGNRCNQHPATATTVHG